MAKAKQVLGKDLMLFVGGKAIALATSCKIGMSAETIDTQSKDSGIWNEKDIKNWVGIVLAKTASVRMQTLTAMTNCLP